MHLQKLSLAKLSESTLYRLASMPVSAEHRHMACTEGSYLARSELSAVQSKEFSRIPALVRQVAEHAVNKGSAAGAPSTYWTTEVESICLISATGNASTGNACA